MSEYSSITGHFPLVSVVIPAYNCDRYIVEAIDSVLSQTYTHTEIIVVNDGSTDGTQQLLAQYQAERYQDKVHIVEQGNAGVAAARNKGVALAKGELIAFLDADDVFFPEKLEKQVAQFARSPSLGMVISGWQIVTQQGERVSAAAPWEDRPNLDLSTAILYKPARPSATMLRRDWYDQVGGFDTKLSSAEDLDFLLRLMVSGCEAAWLPEVQVSYRQHAGSLMTQGKHLLINTERVMSQLFDRADLPADVRALRQQERYQSLVWLAARMYYDGHYAEAEDCLKQSLGYVEKRDTQVIFEWFQAFKGYADEYGYRFEAYALTNSAEWKAATTQVLFPWHVQGQDRLQQASSAQVSSAQTSSAQVLLYSDDPGAGGILQCNHAIVCQLARSGYSTTHVHYVQETPLTEQARSLGVESVDLGYHADSDMTRSFKDIEGAKQCFEAAAPDLIIFSDGWPFSNLAAKQAAIELRIPYLIVLGFIEPSCVEYGGEDGVSYRDLAALQYAQARAVVAVSQENLQLLRKLFYLPDKVGQVIYNGRPKEYFESADEGNRQRLREAHNIPTDGVVCFTSGRLEPVKGYQYQIEAMKQLRARAVWSQLYFVWAGPGAGQLSRSNEVALRAAVEAVGAADRVRFLGQRWDVADWLEASDIFVLASEAEGMPLSVMEAMAKGLPVVASAVSGVPEELGDTGQLLTSPMEDAAATVNELASTILAWAGSAELRQRVGQNCQQRARRLFQQETMVAQYEEVVRRVLQESKSMDMSQETRLPGRSQRWSMQKAWDVQQSFRYAAWIWLSWSRYVAEDFEGMDVALEQALRLRSAEAGWPIFEWGQAFMRFCKARGVAFDGENLTHSVVWRRLTAGRRQ